MSEKRLARLTIESTYCALCLLIDNRRFLFDYSAGGRILHTCRHTSSVARKMSSLIQLWKFKWKCKKWKSTLRADAEQYWTGDAMCECVYLDKRLNIPRHVRISSAHPLQRLPGWLVGIVVDCAHSWDMKRISSTSSHTAQLSSKLKFPLSFSRSPIHRAICINNMLKFDEPHEALRFH